MFYDSLDLEVANLTTKFEVLIIQIWSATIK